MGRVVNHQNAMTNDKGDKMKSFLRIILSLVLAVSMFSFSVAEMAGGIYPVVEVIKKTANLREKASKKSNLIEKVKKGDQLLLLNEEKAGKELWYYVEHDSVRGYIRSDMVKILDEKHGTSTSSGSWQDVYRNFILGKEYKGTVKDQSYGDTTYSDPFGNEYYDIDGGVILFGLHDMNADGIPELFADTGWFDGGLCGCHIYTCKEGKLTYIGTVSNRNSGPSVIEGYPGVVTSTGNNGYFGTSYYSLDSKGNLQTTEVYSEDWVDPNDYTADLDEPVLTVEDKDLYDALQDRTVTAIYTYTESELTEATWNDFISWMDTGNI